MPVFRHVIAFCAAVLIVAVGVGFCIQTRRTVLETTRQNLRGLQAAGELSDELQEADIDQIEPGGNSSELPSGLVFRLTVADFLSAFWFVFVPLVFVVCFAVAAFFGRGSK